MGSEVQHTSNLQLALHLVFTEIIDGPAGVFAPVKQAWPSDIKSQHALVVLHQELGVFTDDHIVLQPDDLWLFWSRRQSRWDRGEEMWKERINRARHVERGGEQREERESWN